MTTSLPHFSNAASIIHPGGTSDGIKRDRSTRSSKRTSMMLPLILLLALYTTLGPQQPLPSAISFTQRRQASTTATINEDDRRYHNVLLQGQFNYDTSPSLIEGWVRAWSQYFSNIIVVGPFSPKTQAALTRLGLSFRTGRNDRGYVSPYENLMLTLLEYKHHPTIDGVFYLHDDALVNLTRFTGGGGTMSRPFPTDSIVGTLRAKQEVDYSIQVIENNATTVVHYSKDGNHYDSPEALLKHLKHWFWNGMCINGYTTMVLDPEYTYRYNDTTANDNNAGTIASRVYSVAPPGQSDILFVPTRYADAFAHEARPHIANKVFLECALPTIVHHLVEKTKVGRRKVELCTHWIDYTVRNEKGTKMIDDCLHNVERIGHSVYHPFKISVNGVHNWTNMLHQVQGYKQKRNRTSQKQ
jgi:hypothetical protein